MLIAGIDEAGRGAVIGPLVIAGVVMKEEELCKLAELGVKDSKLLSPQRREALAKEIKKIAQDYNIVELCPKEIDYVVQNGRRLRKLNWLEAQTMAKTVQALRPDKVYVDASDIKEARFKQQIQECLSYRVEIISEHKADRNYPIVSAASIIAKVERDRQIAELARTYGDFGSGYPSDTRTMDFLATCLRDFKEYPSFVRKSWKPAKKTKEDSHQTRLTWH